MTSDIILPPLVAWASGTLARGALILKSTRLADLNGLFADRDAWAQCDPHQTVYDVEMLESPAQEGALFVGVTHLHAGKIGREFFMTAAIFINVVNRAKSILACGEVACFYSRRHPAKPVWSA